MTQTFQRTVTRGPSEAIEPRLFNRTESFRFFDKAGCLDIASLRVPDSQMDLARVRSTGHEILLEEPDRLSVILPWAGTIRSEVKGELFGTGASGVLVFDPNRRRTIVERPSVRAPYVADLMTIPTAALHEACRENDLTPILNHHLLLLHTPLVAQLRRMVSQTLSRLERESAAVDTRVVLSHVTVSLTDALAGIATALAPPGRDPPSAGRRRVSQALELMEALHAEPSSITAICRLLGCSSRSLQLAFLGSGLPCPHEVLEDIRLDRARVHLLCGTMNVTQAAGEAGFVHLSRFAGLYRRKFGEYPVQTLARS